MYLIHKLCTQFKIKIYERHNYWAHVPQLLKPARVPRARAPHQEEPPQWEARAPQRAVAPAHRN